MARWGAFARGKEKHNIAEWVESSSLSAFAL